MSGPPSDTSFLIAENETLRATVEALTENNKGLEQQLEWFKRQLFGRKSEKCVFESADQLKLDLLGEDADTSPDVETEKIPYERRKARRDGSVTDSGLRFDDTVPVERIDIPAPEFEGEDADEYEVVGEKVTRRLAQRPGSYVILEYHRPVLKRKTDKTMKTTPAPLAVLDRAFADVSLLAGILVDKFSYHLPLYRQHQRMSDNGITLSRVTLTHYVHRSIELLKPIYDAQLSHILQGRTIAVDETPIKAGRKKKEKRNQPGKMKASWFWPVFGEENEICFTWSTTRGSAHLEDQLRDFKGTLLSDGYKAYDTFVKSKPDIQLAQCWAHTRRYFERAKDSHPKALHALEQIAEIYRVEAEIRERELSGDQKLLHRSRHAKPAVDSFLEWCRRESLRPDLVDSDLLSKALAYTTRHAAQLQVFLSDPDVPIDNNHVERALRVIPMGRKHWPFCWTEVGAELVGVIQSLLSTCRLHSVDPYTYLVDVLQRIADHPASRVEELTPRLWKELFADDPRRSDLDVASPRPHWQRAG